MINKLWIGIEFPETFAAIKALGLQPALILIEGLDVSGYDQVILDEDDKRKYVNDELVTVRREWPSPAIGLTIIDLFTKEGGAGRK